MTPRSDIDPPATSRSGLSFLDREVETEFRAAFHQQIKTSLRVIFSVIAAAILFNMAVDDQLAPDVAPLAMAVRLAAALILFAAVAATYAERFDPLLPFYGPFAYLAAVPGTTTAFALLAPATDAAAYAPAVFGMMLLTFVIGVFLLREAIVVGTLFLAGHVYAMLIGNPLPGDQGSTDAIMLATAYALGVAAAWRTERMQRRDFAARRRLEAEMRRSRELAAQAEAANRAKSDFLARMTHELRTPLNAVLGYAEMIRDQMLGPIDDRYRDYARDIHRSGSHLLSLIEDLLEMSRIEAGKLELREEVFDPREVAEAAHSVVRSFALERGVSVSIKVAPEVGRLKADRRILLQILLNLLNNATKFSFPGGHVACVIACEADGRPTLCVRDHGIGIPADKIDLVLQPFGQANNAPNDLKKSGTGLGLAIVKAFAEMHGGTLTIDSEPDQGTTIKVFLPAARLVAAELA